MPSKTFGGFRVTAFGPVASFARRILQCNKQTLCMVKTEIQINILTNKIPSSTVNEKQSFLLVKLHIKINADTGQNTAYSVILSAKLTCLSNYLLVQQDYSSLRLSGYTRKQKQVARCSDKYAVIDCAYTPCMSAFGRQPRDQSCPFPNGSNPIAHFGHFQ